MSASSSPIAQTRRSAIGPSKPKSGRAVERPLRPFAGPISRSKADLSRPRCQDDGRCFLTLYARAEAGRPRDCWVPCRSGPLWFIAWSGHQKSRRQSRRARGIRAREAIQPSNRDRCCGRAPGPDSVSTRWRRAQYSTASGWFEAYPGRRISFGRRIAVRPNEVLCYH